MSKPWYEEVVTHPTQVSTHGYLDFGQALAGMKCGEKAARSIWEDKSLAVTIQRDYGKPVRFELNGDSFLPTFEDLIAEDWYIK